MENREVRKLAAVMFTDIQGYSAMVQHDEKGALKNVSLHRQFLEEYTSSHNGKVIQFYGDGSLSIYDSAVDAVYCAIKMQESYRSGVKVPVRIGIHVGDIVFKDDTVFGDGVNISSRIQAMGVPNSILISHRVQSELANHRDIKTKSLGLARLKNITVPLEIFAITNEGLSLPPGFGKISNINKVLRYALLICIACLVVWVVKKQWLTNSSGNDFTHESISVPVFTNHTGVDSLDQIGQMASHWITKELSSTPSAHVVSYESASEMIKLAGMDFSSPTARRKYASLTGAVNIVEASFYQTGAQHDSLTMGGYFTNLHTGEVMNNIPDVKCKSTDPMDCIKAIADEIKGFWASRNEHMLTPPKYEAYKAYLAARTAWRTEDKAYVFEQLNLAIKLDPTFQDPYYLMLDYFYNEGENVAARDTIEAIRKKFTDLNPRQLNMLDYHTADIEGKNKEAYDYFMKEYALDAQDLFTNNSAMVLALEYRNDPQTALKFFDAIPFDSLRFEGCYYCASRLDLGMWAALESGNMKVADRLAPKLNAALYNRQSYGMLIMYYVWKKDTTQINFLINAAKEHPHLDRPWEYLNFLAGRLFLLRGEKALSRIYAQKAIAVYLAFPVAFGRNLARSYYLNDQFDKSLQYCKTAKLYNEVDSQRIASEIGMIYARIGDTLQAKKIIQSLEKLRRPIEYGATEYYQGRIYALMGDLDNAVIYLSNALKKGQKFLRWETFADDPDLMVLKDYPPYKKLLSTF